MFIKGNIDGVNIILNGSREQVYEEAKRCIEATAPGGGYVLSSACSIPPHAPAANISKLIEAAERFGYYGNYEAAPARTDSQ
jgi:uroporphyrinogen decarboxylase